VHRPAILTDSNDEAVRDAARLLGVWSVVRRDERELADALRSTPGARVIIATTHNPIALRAIVARAAERGVPVVAGCTDDAARRRALEAGTDEWFRMPATGEEVAGRIRTALTRKAPVAHADARRADEPHAERILFDSLTGLPTLPMAIEEMRPHIVQRSEMVVVYCGFVRYAKVEELFGWETLDAVLETTAAAIRDYLARSVRGATRAMIAHAHDEDFIVFHVPEVGDTPPSDAAITRLIGAVRERIATHIEATHGPDIGALFDVVAGYAHVHYTPTARLERLIYRAVREAASAARSVEQHERARRVADLRACLRDRAIYIDYHPIVAAATGQVFGYEALARGFMRTLRSPEVMFEIAAHADLSWELARLCRNVALVGLTERIGSDAFLFLNVDPHDFADPGFADFDAHVPEPSRVVLEVTERTAIKDYPAFRAQFETYRQKGYRLAVDDAGAGYAGLGSIANLEPDFIKLDMSLIHGIDTNFIKQNLVETMVRYANEQGAMVIAEGVERAEEFDIVKSLGVHLVQGFYLHRSTTGAELHDSVPTTRSISAP
jgi:EAL domain-containing protein (putative c-di-GMP-specific phosphodiesterase class I)/GGDEF domain-containing protein